MLALLTLGCDKPYRRICQVQLEYATDSTTRIETCHYFGPQHTYRFPDSIVVHRSVEHTP